MTREELKRGQKLLYQRLYEPEAFAARLLGNLSRFHDVHYQPERTNAVSSFVMLRPNRAALLECRAQRRGRFFWAMLWRGCGSRRG